MTNTYNTLNPLGSSAPKDLYDNASNIDDGVNSPLPSFRDRFNQIRLSWTGMEVGFSTAQQARQLAFDQFLSTSGYSYLGDYAAGLVFTNRTQYMVRSGIPYRLQLSVPIPYTTTGDWGTEAANFLLFSFDNVLSSDLANSSDPTKGAALVGYKGRTVAANFTDFASIKSFGAVGDDLTDSTTAISNAQSAFASAYVPLGIYKTTAPADTLNSNFYGQGQLRTGANKRGKFFSAIKAPPASLGNEGSVVTAFDGDWSHNNFCTEHRITGAATLGQPTTGYVYIPEAMPHYSYLYTASGWNQDTASNEGRTGVAAYRTKVDQYGQGDAVCYNGTAFVTGTRAGSTHFLANPAAVLFNGDMTAGADGVYLNPYETFVQDNGFDVACVGIVNNFGRSNGGGAKSCFWGGYRGQSVGSVAMDSLISAVGKWTVGLDFAMDGTDFGTNQAAISLKANQRIYLNNAANASGPLEAGWRTTVFNGDYISYTGGQIVVAAGGVPSLEVSSNQVTIASPNGLLISSTGVLRFAGGNQYGTGSSAATFSASNKPGAVGSGPANWVIVNLGGTPHYIPAWV